MNRDVDALKITGLDKVSGSSNYAVTKYAYDSMNRCTSQTDALGQKVTNTYDINGNLLKTVDRNGYTLTYNYDGLNQLTQKSSSKSSDDTYTYTYNMKGNRTSMTGGGINTTSTYDSLGRLVKESLTDGIVKEYNYDINGNRKSFKFTKNGTVQYTLTYDYDKMNQLTKVYENGAVKAEYTYNPDGTLKKSSYGSQTADYSYNLASLLTEVNNANGSTQISKYSYTYYVDGNQKSKTESVAGVSKGTTNYTYDGVNRLVKEQTPDNTYSYQYDIYGNRSQLNITGDETYTTSYTYDKNNRLTNQTKVVSGASEVTDFWYDPNGNQISSMTTTVSGIGTPSMGIEPAGGDTNSYSEYDSWNQLTRTMQNGKTTSYTYNGDGLRMSKTVDGVTTSHIWDGTNIAGDVTNGTVTKYIRGLQLISSKKGSTENFYTYNGHGDVAQLTNSSGAITKQYSYDAFGVEINKADNDTNPFRYCGEYYDTETDSVYLRARYYKPTAGRFITEDSYWNVGNMIFGDNNNFPEINSILQSTVLYTYCNNNPVKYIDPSGYYDRDEVKKYIDKWWNDRNPEYYSYRTDCANFVSQCLVAGGIRKKLNWFSYRSKKERFNPAGLVINNEKYDWYISETWRLAQKQFEFFSNPYNGFIEGDVLQLWSIEGMEYNVKYSNIQVGDLMYFADRETRTIHHATIISKVENGKVYFAGHTNSRYEQDLSDYFDDEMVFIVRIRDAAINGYVN